MPRSIRALNYYGSKVQAAHRYPAPQHDLIIEPFAGGAGYSLLHRTRNVILVDKSEDVIGAWKYLIRTAGAEILKLPLLEPGEAVPGDLELGARLLIGWNVGMNGARPQGNLVPCAARVPSSFWGESKRRALAGLADTIKHWKAFCIGYEALPNRAATWFIDAPYFGVIGSHYLHNSAGIDYDHLGNWSHSRRGQVIVCEGPGADWLPFRSHHDHVSAPTADVVGRRRTMEMIWTKGC